MENFESFIDEDEVNHKIISNLNSVFGKDVSNLKKTENIIEELLVTQKALEERLKFATSEAPDKIFKAINEAEEALEKSKLLQVEMDRIDEEMKNFKKEYEILVDTLLPNIRIIQNNERIRQYREYTSVIENLCEQIKFHLKSGNEAETMHCYERLKQEAEMILQSHCSNLKKYSCEMLYYWYKNLKEKFGGELETVLKSLKWPFPSEASLKEACSSKENIQRLQILFGYLLQIDIPESILEVCSTDKSLDETDEKRVPSFIAQFSVSILPLKILLKPFEVRFFYHFSGTKATNSKNNPEWYFTQVLKWISCHNAFFEEYIQPVLNKNAFHKVIAKVEFMRGLIRLIVLKLRVDFPDSTEEDLFTQTVQETLNLDRELRLSLGYPNSQPSVLNVLTDPSVFNSWLSLEKKFAVELIDEFISREDAWLMEEIGVSVCGGQLVLLLQGITDRYKYLPQPGHRLQFLNLQLYLVDDFRVRILQLTKGELSDPLHSSYCSILNTVHYITNTLNDWSDLPFFIECQYFKEKLEKLEKLNEMSVFDKSSDYLDIEVKSDRIQNFGLEDSFSSAYSHVDIQDAFASLNLQCGSQAPSSSQLIEIKSSAFLVICELYSRIENEMTSVITEYVLTEVRAKSQVYRKDKWFFTPSGNNAVSASSILDISPSFCFILEILVKHLNLLKEKLLPQIFSNFWKSLSVSLDKFIYEEMILQNNFSEYGGAQLHHDMKKGLFPIFGEFHSKPENYFPYVIDCLVVLTLPRPTALLLRDTLKYSGEPGSIPLSAAKILEEHSIFTLNLKEVGVILNIRTNMAIL